MTSTIPIPKPERFHVWRLNCWVTPFAGNTVEYDSDNHQQHTTEQQYRVSFCRTDIIDQHTQDKSQTDTNRESHRHTGYSDSCRQQNIAGIEYDTAQKKRYRYYSNRPEPDREGMNDPPFHNCPLSGPTPTKRAKYR